MSSQELVIDVARLGVRVERGLKYPVLGEVGKQ